MYQETIEKMLQDKLNAAKQDGIAEGREIALFEVARRMSDDDCDIDLISRVTGLSTIEIKCVLASTYKNRN